MKFCLEIQLEVLFSFKSILLHVMFYIYHLNHKLSTTDNKKINIAEFF